MEWIGDLLLTVKFFKIKVINWEDFLELMVRFFFNLGVTLVIARFIYYAKTKRKSYLFTYLLFSTIIFFLCQLLSNVKLELGFALGLFALFGIIRYRTNSIPIKEMTYLFLIIGVATINALANKKVSYAELVFTNFMIVLIAFGLERWWLNKRLESNKLVIYEKINLIKPENYNALLKDLSERTGLEVHRAEIGRVDFMRDVARIRIFYFEKEGSLSYSEDNGYEDDELD